jgi:sarcosine oxidase subunit beta
VKTNQKKIRAIVTDEKTIQTNVVVNAAGIHSKAIAEMVKLKLPLTPLRKEIMATERLQPLFEAMVISFKDGIYFSQQKEGQIVGGIPIPEEKPGYRTMPTFAFLQHMTQTLTRYAPILKHVNLLRHWTGFYDVTPDARPILGEVKELKDFIQCNGFSGHGFMISPMVSKLLTDLIADGKTSEVLENLSLERFKGKKIEKELSVVG